MGWKASAIFIKPAGNIDDQKLLDLFGYGEAVADKELSNLESAINPADNYLYIARFNDGIAICVQDFPDRFYEQELSYIEQQLINIFPAGEILAISLHSVTNHYGYALIQNGRKLRVNTGPGHNKPVLFEMGKPLPEEIALPARTDGEQLVFYIASRFFGEPMDKSDKFFEIKTQGYQKEKEEKEVNIEIVCGKGGMKASFFYKYRFAFVVLLVILYYLIRNFWK